MAQREETASLKPQTHKIQYIRSRGGPGEGGREIGHEQMGEPEGITRGQERMESKAEPLLLFAFFSVRRRSSTLALSTLLWRGDGTVRIRILQWGEMGSPRDPRLRTHIVQILVIVIVDILVVVVVLIHHIVFEGLSCEVIHGLGNDLFLDVLSELVVHLELLIEFVEDFLVDLVVVYGILCGRDRGSEEVEEGFGGAGLANQPGSIRVCQRDSSRWANEGERGISHALLFLCFLISNSFVRSFSSFHLTTVPMARS